ncbi:MAG: inositol monophosphatase family protein [Chloroflexota bacterium]|nr:histidinol phosphate phosphatase [Dehalococcoidia bacterium]MDW8252415.1 inositol monophosphatase family protein [Chloroflexota bacterium]
MSDESIAALRDFAAEVAVAAGRLTLGYFQNDVATEWKADRSPVTAADREAELLIRRRIEARYPHHGIIGEEWGDTRPGAAHRWIIDPIDGTRSFVRGVPLYAVLIAVEREGAVIAGAIYLPGLDELVSAGRGLGCFWNGRRCRVSTVSQLEQAYLLSSSFKHPTRRALIDRLVAAAGTARTWGDGYGYALVATGRAEIMFDLDANPWDFAAPRICVEEAGGRFSDFSGRAVTAGGDGVATNGLLHEAVLRVAQTAEEHLRL